MHRRRIAGLVLMMVGIFFLTRSMQHATASRVGAFAGGLLIAVGLVRVLRPNRTRLL